MAKRRRRASRARPAQPQRPAVVSSGDAERVVLAIAKQPVCVACLVKATGVARPRVESALRVIEPILQVRTPAICHACLDGGKVFRLA